MLKIVIPEGELFDEERQEFISTKECALTLEHSLVSVSKWESKWHKPFLTKEPKTIDETIDYVKCMTITQNVDDNVYNNLTAEHIQNINDYIEDPMTATWFSSGTGSSSSHEQITSELIYYWMTALNIPQEYQKWHLNRLLTLIKICNVKNQPPKKMNSRKIMSENARLNAQRKKQYNTKG